MNHSFNTKLAERYGIEGAILIEHLYFWIRKNECNDECINDGHVWCYSTFKGFNKYIPYMNPQKIRRELVCLESKGLILTGNFNKSSINQTLWYAFTDNFIKEMECLGYDFSKMKNGIFKNEKCNEDNIKEDNNKEKKDKKEFLSKKREEDKEYQEREHNFLEYMKKECPLVQKMTEPITYEQYLELVKHNDRDVVLQVFSDMNNWAELRKKRVSAFKTAQKWLLKQSA